MRPPRRAARRPPRISIPVTLAVVALLYVVAALIARTVPLANLPALVLAASFAYVPLLAVCAVVLAALCRKKLLSMIGIVLLALSVAVQVPWHDLGRTSDPYPRTTELRVLSSNIQKGKVDPTAFINLAVGSADIITMSELTAEAAARFRKGGIRKTFPYSILAPRPGAEGMGLWSRYPLTALAPSEYGNNFIAARVRVPGVRDDPVVASVHLMSPLAGGANTFAQWNHRITAAKAEFADYAETAGPAAVIIAGDFNATPDMRQFRDLLDVGYRDAVNQTGAGFSPTYSPHPAIPPLITIDHVLTRNSTAQSIHTVDIPGTDHRALLATVAVPQDPTAP
ncbi:endonuclease/exonuclease/phosphatase family protein [Mycolicibacterium frederiksbergense]|uniref:endonuclease/exonuclease/phosphatase family protein n=1 Tax=Mycolicibacterium frederiksbergense TaxID=117567 RepID=UPI00265C0D5B|nr:endonuclease/exonuclease/phosphatase family protein [Mycolicibacterium frederiksbergense]MDO0972836.1 endonuclease/exonuclease/phosphatase family protein [Mycolicibacterium frederiksbergense]